MMCDADVCGLIPTTRLKRVFEWGVKQAPREAPDSECWGPSFGPLRKANISEGTQKWTLLGSKVVPPGGPVFGPFILSDVLKLCKLLCAQNVKLEATLTQTASVAGILNCRKIFGKVTYWRLSYSAIVAMSCQLHWEIELKHSTE